MNWLYVTHTQMAPMTSRPYCTRSAGPFVARGNVYSGSNIDRELLQEIQNGRV